MTENKEGWELITNGPYGDELWRLRVSGGWLVKNYSFIKSKTLTMCFIPKNEKEANLI